jgi:hypothetical protein
VRTRVNTGGAGWWAGLAAVLLVTPAFGQEPWRFATDERVVAFGDVHGAYAELVELLQEANVVDADLRWSAGAAHVVSLGDLLDRGAETRPVLDLMLRLEREAAAAGGKLHVVLGNHELMTLLGDWRYVARGDYASFAADESDEERAAAYAAFAAAAGDSPTARAAFESSFPRGYFARQAAFAPTGRYGAWLLERPALIVVNDTAYVHGGLPPAVAQHGLGFNERLRAALDRYFILRDRLVASGVLPAFDHARDLERAAAATPGAERDEFLAIARAAELGSESPLWYRGSAYCKPILEQPVLDAALERLGVTRAVVGHTPTADRRVRSLYGGKLVMLDTGMLADYYYGRPAVLVVDGEGEPTARYAASAGAAVPEVGHAVAYGRTEAELRAALDDATLASVQGAGTNEPWQVVVQDGDAALAAVFYPARDGGAAEHAAAALDDLLGTDLVAPTVARTIEGERGALQLEFSGAISELERAEQRLPFSGWCALEPQLELMRAFDALILNPSRSAATVQFANDLTDLLLVNHAEAFASQSLPAAVRDLPLPGRLRAALRSLDEAGLTAALGAWLDRRQIRALLARRDRLLELAPSP